ncbi:hypothetical protein GCM10019017_22430 [Streptomyces showdoensis]
MIAPAAARRRPKRRHHLGRDLQAPHGLGGSTWDLNFMVFSCRSDCYTADADADTDADADGPPPGPPRRGYSA